MVFSQGCNFRCPFCHNGTLLASATPSSPLIPTSEILTYLAKRAGKISGLVISGGEPTMQRELSSFCRQVKKLGLAIKLDTNGSRPEVLSELLNHHLLDFIAMDIKAPLSSYAKLAGREVNSAAIASSIKIIAESGLNHLFRTTNVTPLLSSADRQSILSLVPFGSTHIFQPFIASNALDQQLAKVAA